MIVATNRCRILDCTGSVGRQAAGAIDCLGLWPVIGSAYATAQILSSGRRYKPMQFKNMETERKQTIPLGQVYVTPGIQRAIDECGDNLWDFIHRHQSGDWGDVDVDDKQANDKALTNDGRLLSAYHTSTGIKLWIITEWDRSVTTVLLPEEY